MPCKKPRPEYIDGVQCRRRVALPQPPLAVPRCKHLNQKYLQSHTFRCHYPVHAANTLRLAVQDHGDLLYYLL